MHVDKLHGNATIVTNHKSDHSRSNKNLKLDKNLHVLGLDDYNHSSSDSSEISVRPMKEIDVESVLTK